MRKQSWAWLIPVIGCSAMPQEPMDDLVGVARASCVFFAAGAFLGWLWNRIYPRPLGERLAGVATCVCVLVALVFLSSFMPDGMVDVTVNGPSSSTAGILGIVVALVLVEARRLGPGRSFVERRARSRGMAMTTWRSSRDLR